MANLFEDVARLRTLHDVIEGKIVHDGSHYDYLNDCTQYQKAKLLSMAIQNKNVLAVSHIFRYIENALLSSSAMRQIFEACESAQCESVVKVVAQKLNLCHFRSAHLCELYTPCLIDLVIHSPSNRNTISRSEQFWMKILSDGTTAQINAYLDRNPKDGRYLIRLYVLLDQAITLPKRLGFQLVLDRILGAEVREIWRMLFQSTDNVRSIATLLKLKSEDKLQDMYLDPSSLFVETEDNLTFLFKLTILGIDLKRIKCISKLYCAEGAEGDADFSAERKTIKGIVDKVISIHAEVMDIMFDVLPADLVSLTFDYLV
jgi:hypothetical protein